ncbi:MAG: FkbM family methyltransferase [Caldilineaceae bacterium]
MSLFPPNTSRSQKLGIWRSLLIYYGVPGRQRKLTRFYRQLIRPGDLCFDIGAHVGDRVNIWRKLGARVVAVEPQPLCAHLLRRWYGADAGVTLAPVAVAAQPGEMVLHISPRTPTVTTLSTEWMADVQQVASFADVRWDAQTTVPVTTLDALIDQWGLPAYCKIDVEGFELEVLRGLSQPLQLLSFEYIPAAMPVALNCVARLMALGHYEFNWFPGETHRFQSADWLTSEQMVQILNDMPSHANSGDIYARLLDL